MNSVIFSTTKRLRLRALDHRDFSRLVELAGDWEVAKWLGRMPHPFNISDAENFYALMHPLYEAGKPELFMLSFHDDDSIIGAVGLHKEWPCPSHDGSAELGYWLGREYWGRGLMSEAVEAAVKMAWNRLDISRITSRTDQENIASQKILRKACFRFLGLFPRPATDLRGSPQETRWELIKDGK